MTTLNSDQLAALDDVMKNCVGERMHMALMGPAGTGKTVTAKEIVRRVKHVLILAPTHKALNIVKSGLPKSAKAWTTAKFCQVKSHAWRDEDVFESSAENEQKRIKYLQENFSLVIVDESSMVPHDQAEVIVDLCGQAGIGVLFVGDPYQLAPVKPRPIKQNNYLDDDEASEELESLPAKEFIAAPLIARLTKVVRHGGPILKAATKIRNNWEQIHSFPNPIDDDDESTIEITTNFTNQFIEHFRYQFQFNNNESNYLENFYQAAPRALFYTNKNVKALTLCLRREIYGELASKQYLKGEMITFPDYTNPSIGGAIYSSTDAIVVKSEIKSFRQTHGTILWETPRRKIDRQFFLEFQGTFQQLTVNLILADGSVDTNQRIIVTPLIDDDGPFEQYKFLHEQLKKIEQSNSISPKGAEWAFLKHKKDKWLVRVTSAFVMTLHKSQGSTFEHVYVGDDILRTRCRETRNRLLYVALTRASKGVTFEA